MKMLQSDIQKIIFDHLDKVSSKIRKLIASDDWTTESDNIGTQFNLKESQIGALTNEILFVLIGLTQQNKFTNNIEREMGVSFNIAKSISEIVNKNIFSLVSDDIEELWKNEEGIEGMEQRNSVGGVKIEPSGVGDSFEQMILNQARAMQPAREAGSSSEQLVVSSKGEKTEEKPKQVHDYPAGADPYRELPQ